MCVTEMYFSPFQESNAHRNRQSLRGSSTTTLVETLSESEIGQKHPSGIDREKGSSTEGKDVPVMERKYDI